MANYDARDLDARLQQASEELPEGFQIQIVVERGSGWADLIDPAGIYRDYPCNHEYGLVEQVMDALDHAKEIAIVNA